jgi:ABC-type branched-subunit amino acid transport system ATPase component
MWRLFTTTSSWGAGKSTTLKAISGILKGEEGKVTDGSITYLGDRIDNTDPEGIVRRGIFQVMEGRRVFDDLNVDENLIAGAHTRKSRAEVKKDMEMVFDYFPRLTERRNTLSGYLSGGEQQMLAIGRALMARPRLMLLDEPSLGLAPLLVKEIFEIIQRINREEKTTILLVEQNARLGTPRSSPWDCPRAERRKATGMSSIIEGERGGYRSRPIIPRVAGSPILDPANGGTSGYLFPRALYLTYSRTPKIQL